MTAGATTVTWTGSAGDGKWATAANWDTGSAPVAADTVVFATADAVVTISADVTVSNLQCDAHVTLQNVNTWGTINLQAVSGTAPITLNRCGFRNVGTAYVDIHNNVEIGGDGTYDSWMNGGADANSRDIRIYGNLLGAGKFTCYGGSSWYNGVQFYGDNSAFTGNIVVNGGGSNRTKFSSLTAGSSNATFTIQGHVPDNGSFYGNCHDGTIYFGALTLESYDRISGGTNLKLEIGTLNKASTIGDANFCSVGTIFRKVGTNSLSCHAWGYAGLELVDGTFIQTSPSTANIPSSYLTFLGGTFAWKESAVDISGKIKNSTSPIAIDTGSTNITFATALASSNAGGLTKKGSGTLTLSAKPAYTGTTTVEAGTLVVPVGTTFETLAITNGAALAIPGDPLTWTNGATVALFTYSSIVGTTNIVITGLGARASVAYDFTTTPGTCLAVISNDKLVWAGADGDDWSAENKWVMQISQEAATFQTGDAVILNDTALGANPATNSINLSTAVSPILIAANVSAGHGYKLTGEAVTGDAVALKKTGDGVLILTNASNAFAGDVTVDGGELVVSAPVTGGISNSAALRIASAKPVTLGAVGGSGVTYVDSGTAVFTAALAQPVTNSGTAVLAANQTLNGLELAGTGNWVISNSTLTVSSQSTFAAANGTLTVPSGATLAVKNNHDATDTYWSHYPLGAVRLVFAGGTLEGFSPNNNAAITNDIYFAEGTTSQINNTSATGSSGINLNLNGRLAGAGSVTILSYDRGTILNGNNSDFIGTFTFEPAGRWQSSSFCNAAAGSAAAAWNLTSPNADIPYLYFKNAAGSTLYLGAFNVTQPRALISVENQGSIASIGARNEDCAIEGRFINKIFTLVKVGEARLTLGTNFSCAADSTIAVSNGTLEVNALSLSNGTLTVEAPATLAGTGTLSNSVTFADGATLAPGSSGAGTMTLQTEPALAGKLNFAFAVDGTGATTALAVPRLNLSNLKLALASGTLDASKTYTLMTGSGFSGTPDLSALPEIAGRSWKVTVDGNAVALSSTAKGTVYRLE